MDIANNEWINPKAKAWLICNLQLWEDGFWIYDQLQGQRSFTCDAVNLEGAAVYLIIQICTVTCQGPLGIHAYIQAYIYMCYIYIYGVTVL